MNRLKDLRCKKGLYQKDIAKLFNVAVSTYSYWEQGRFEPDSETLGKLADFFGVTVDYLLGREKPTISNTEKVVDFPKPKIQDEVEINDLYPRAPARSGRGGCAYRSAGGHRGVRLYQLQTIGGILFRARTRRFHDKRRNLRRVYSHRTQAGGSGQRGHSRRHAERRANGQKVQCVRGKRVSHAGKSRL